MKNKLSYSLLLITMLISSVLLVPFVNSEEDEVCPGIYDGEIGVMVTGFEPWETCDPFYMKLSLSGIPDDPSFIVKNGLNWAYCMNMTNVIVEDTQYIGFLICTYDSSNPDLPPFEWDKINWILNNKQGNWDDIQDAIWIYTDDIEYVDATPTAQDLYDAAETYGEDFVPGELQKLGIYIYLPKQPDPVSGDDIQDLLVEVELPFDYHVPELPLGTITAVATMMAALFIKIKKEK